MTLPILNLAEHVREIYRNKPAAAGKQIERLLEDQFAGVSLAEKNEKIQDLATFFRESSGSFSVAGAGAKDELRQFVSLLLGQQIEAGEMDDHALQMQLCTSLNTIFDSLNQLLKAIQLTCNRDGHQFEETIRHVLKDQLVQDKPEGSLEEYIDQIKKSFFKSLESAQGAHKAIIKKLLAEINPERIMDQSGGGLRIGPLKKAEAFDQYNNVYGELNNWHESGRGHEEFLRTFEKYFSDAANQ